MANRMFNQFQGSLEKGVVQLYLEVTFGAAGSVASFIGKGIESVVYVNTGIYDVVLQDQYVRLLDQTMKARSIDVSIPVAPIVVIGNDMVATSSRIVRVLMYNISGVATNPTSGDRLMGSIVLSNSTAL